MILVDTSVWVSALRVGSGPEATELRALLDADAVALTPPVRVELLAGASSKDLPRLRRTLSALPLLPPGPAVWARIETWVELAVPAGRRFGIADLLIAATADEHGVAVWSLDADFVEIAKLGFVRLHLP